jgi:hypothetical protein
MDLDLYKGVTIMKKVVKLMFVFLIVISLVSIKDTQAKTLTQQDNIISIAMKEKGSRYKKKYGASPWCAAFVSWAARTANISTSIIPKTYSSTTMYKQLLKSGAKIVTKPQKGDIVFYKRSAKSSNMMHVAIMCDSTMSIQGNYSKKVCYMKATNYYSSAGKITKNRIVYVRPNYKTVPSTPSLKSVTLDGNQISAKWNKVSKATKYCIYLKDSNNAIVYSKMIGNVSSYSFVYDEISTGYYTVCIQAYNDIGNSSLSKAKKIKYVEPTDTIYN